jgi:hypothetical protein
VYERTEEAGRVEYVAAGYSTVFAYWHYPDSRRWAFFSLCILSDRS